MQYTAPLTGNEGLIKPVMIWNTLLFLGGKEKTTLKEMEELLGKETIDTYKDMTRTVAEMVRWNGKTYPSPTPVAYFMRHPYNLTMPQMQVALSNLEHHPEYADIKTFVSEKGNTFLYSEPIMSMRYAKALADRAEDDEG